MIVCCKLVGPSSHSSFEGSKNTDVKGLGDRRGVGGEKHEIYLVDDAECDEASRDMTAMTVDNEKTAYILVGEGRGSGTGMEDAYQPIK